MKKIKDKYPSLTDKQKDALGLLVLAGWVEHTYAPSKNYSTGVQVFIKREDRETHSINAAVFKNLLKHGLFEQRASERPAGCGNLPPHTHVYVPTPKLYEAYVLWYDFNGIERWYRVRKMFKNGKIDHTTLTRLIHTIKEDSPWTIRDPSWVKEMRDFDEEHGSAAERARLLSVASALPENTQPSDTELSKRKYENLTPAQKKAVDEAWRAVRTTFRIHSYQSNNNDDAEHLVDALTEYLIKSNPEVFAASAQKV